MICIYANKLKFNHPPKNKRQDILPLVPLPLVCLSLIGYRLFCLHGIGAVYELDFAVHFIGNAGE